MTDERGTYRHHRAAARHLRRDLLAAGLHRPNGARTSSLTTGFTATVNSSLQLGALAENIVVTRQATQVDTVSSSVQTVISQETLDALPLGQSLGHDPLADARRRRARPTPRTSAATRVNRRRASASMAAAPGDFQQFRDGMLTNSLIAAGNWVSSQNPATIEEVVVTSGGFGAHGADRRRHRQHRPAGRRQHLQRDVPRRLRQPAPAVRQPERRSARAKRPDGSRDPAALRRGRRRWRSHPAQQPLVLRRRAPLGDVVVSAEQLLTTPPRARCSTRPT